MKDNFQILEVLNQIVSELEALKNSLHPTSLSFLTAQDAIDIVQSKIRWHEGEQLN